MLGAAVNSAVIFEAVPSGNEEIPISVLIIVTAIGGILTLVILALMCTECITRLRGESMRHTEQEQQTTQQIQSRRSLQTASVQITQPRQTVEPEIESPPRPFSEVLREMYQTYRRMSQTSAEGYQVENMHFERAEEVLDELHWRRPALTPPVEQRREFDPSSEELDRYSVFTNSQVRSDLESTYVQRMNEIGEQLAAEGSDASPRDTPPLLFGRYRATPPPSYAQIIRERNQETPPPRYSWAMDQRQKIMGSQSPLESQKSLSGEQLQFHMSMSSTSDDSKESNVEAAAAAAILPKVPMVRGSRAPTRSSPINIPHGSLTHHQEEIAHPRIAMGLAMLHRCVEKMKKMTGSVPDTKDEMCSSEQEAVSSMGDDSTAITETIAEAARRDYISADPRAAVALPIDRTKTIAKAEKTHDISRDESKSAVPMDVDAANNIIGKTKNISVTSPGSEAGAVVSIKASAIDVKDLIRRTRNAMSRAIALATMAEPKGAESPAIALVTMAASKGAESLAMAEDNIAKPKGATDRTIMENTMARDDIERAWAEMKTAMRRWSREESATSQAEMESTTAEARRPGTESAVIQVTNDEMKRAWAEMKATLSRSREESAASRAVEHALAEARSRIESRSRSARIQLESEGATGDASQEGAVAQADASREPLEMGGARPKDPAKKKKKKTNKIAVMM